MIVVFHACSDSDTTTPVEKRPERVEFIPGRYRAEIIEIDSDCEPRLEDIIAATNQPRDGIVQLVYEDQGEFSAPFAWFSLAEPRIDGGFEVPATFRCEINEQNPSCSFLPDEMISVGASPYYWLTCYRPAEGTIFTPEVKIYQGYSSGVFEVEITHPWNDSMIFENACLPLETYPRKACVERFITRYTLERECPLNCSALDSGQSMTVVDIFPNIEGEYNDITLPEELHECLPYPVAGPLIGGECPEEVIVRP